VSKRDRRINAFLNVGIWLMFIALLVPAGVVGWAIGRHDSGTKAAAAVAKPAAVSALPWSLPNGDLVNTRATRHTPISAANVSKLGVAWTMPLTASSVYGTFAANPVTDAGGTVYLQDLASNVFAIDLMSGRVRWTRRYNSQDIGPNGVTVAGGKVYGATAKFAFALDAETGPRALAEHEARPCAPAEGRRRARQRLRH